MDGDRRGLKLWTRAVGLPLAILLSAPLAVASDTSTESEADRGRRIYERQCALCHGSSGRADGPASYLLFPPAREFARGRFKLVGTTNGVPSDEDLLATLRRGMPGSAMPSWSWMPEEDLRAVAGHVRSLAIRGLFEDLRMEASEDSDDDLMALARERMTPSEPVPVGATAAATPEIIEVGRRAFVKYCAGCHGEDGKGRADVLRRDEDGVMNWARDFTSGILKGGSSHEAIAKRLQSGIHGTVMPATDLSQDQRLSLITYVRHLIPRDAEDRLVQRRERFVAERVESAIEDPGSLDWGMAIEVPIALAPLWWRDEAITGARVAAMHDGTSLAIRIRWKDATANAPEPGAPPYADSVAVQLTTEERPALFGMAHSDAPTNLWHWRALRAFDLNDFDAAIALFPHRIGDWLNWREKEQQPLYRLAEGRLMISGESISVRPAGMRVLGGQEALPPSITAAVSWQEGEWQVILHRQFEAVNEREITLSAGKVVSINFAIWNGEIRDLRGQKSVTIWHELELRP